MSFGFTLCDTYHIDHKYNLSIGNKMQYEAIMKYIQILDLIEFDYHLPLCWLNPTTNDFYQSEKWEKKGQKGAIPMYCVESQPKKS